MDTWIVFAVLLIVQRAYGYKSDSEPPEKIKLTSETRYYYPEHKSDHPREHSLGPSRQDTIEKYQSNNKEEASEPKYDLYKPHEDHSAYGPTEEDSKYIPHSDSYSKYIIPKKNPSSFGKHTLEDQNDHNEEVEKLEEIPRYGFKREKHNSHEYKNFGNEDEDLSHDSKKTWEQNSSEELQHGPNYRAHSSDNEADRHHDYDDKHHRPSYSEQKEQLGKHLYPEYKEEHGIGNGRYPYPKHRKEPKILQRNHHYPHHKEGIVIPHGSYHYAQHKEPRIHPENHHYAHHKEEPRIHPGNHHYAQHKEEPRNYPRNHHYPHPNEDVRIPYGSHHYPEQKEEARIHPGNHHYPHHKEEARIHSGNHHYPHHKEDIRIPHGRHHYPENGERHIYHHEGHHKPQTGEKQSYHRTPHHPEHKNEHEDHHDSHPLRYQHWSDKGALSFPKHKTDKLIEELGKGKSHHVPSEPEGISKHKIFPGVPNVEEFIKDHKLDPHKHPANVLPDKPPHKEHKYPDESIKGPSLLKHYPHVNKYHREHHIQPFVNYKPSYNFGGLRHGWIYRPKFDLYQELRKDLDVKMRLLKEHEQKLAELQKNHLEKYHALFEPHHAKMFLHHELPKPVIPKFEHKDPFHTTIHDENHEHISPPHKHHSSYSDYPKEEEDYPSHKSNYPLHYESPRPHYDAPLPKHDHTDDKPKHYDSPHHKEEYAP